MNPGTARIRSLNGPAARAAGRARAQRETGILGQPASPGHFVIHKSKQGMRYAMHFIASKTNELAATEFESIDLGDLRRNRRAIRLIERLSAKPTASIQKA